MTEVSLEDAGALAPLITAEEARIRAAEGAVVFDVRGSAASDPLGVLEGATAVDRTTIVRDFAFDSTERLGLIEKDTPVVVACGSVRGSGPVAAQLIELGYTNVVHVDGGVPAIREIAE